MKVKLKASRYRMIFQALLSTAASKVSISFTRSQKSQTRNVKLSHPTVLLCRSNRKHKINISLYSSSKSAQQQQQLPPKEFLYPIYGSLMPDLVVVSFEWLSVQVYGYLGFTPTLEVALPPPAKTTTSLILPQ